jgi:hypothetical protein
VHIGADKSFFSVATKDVHSGIFKLANYLITDISARVECSSDKMVVEHIDILPALVVESEDTDIVEEVDIIPATENDQDSQFIVISHGMAVSLC